MQVAQKKKKNMLSHMLSTHSDIGEVKGSVGSHLDKPESPKHRTYDQTNK